jgi:hypothetical protein
MLIAEFPKCKGARSTFSNLWHIPLIIFQESTLFKSQHDMGCHKGGYNATIHDKTKEDYGATHKTVSSVFCFHFPTINKCCVLIYSPGEIFICIFNTKKFTIKIVSFVSTIYLIFFI